MMFDPEADLPPSRTSRQRTQPPAASAPSSLAEDVRARVTPPSPARPRDEDEIFGGRTGFGLTEAGNRAPRPGPLPARGDRRAPAGTRRPGPFAVRGRGAAIRRRAGGRGCPPSPTPPPRPAFGDDLLPEPGFEDRAEPPRRRGGRDAIRNRGGDREPARERARPAPESRAIEPEFERPRAVEPERPRPVEPERPRPVEPERPRPVEPERGPAYERPERGPRRGAEAERPTRDRDRDRESTRPIDRAGEEGYVPRRMRSSESAFGGEAAPSWPDLEDDHSEEAEVPAEEGAETESEEGTGQRRRRRRRRRGERDRPAREPGASRAPADDLDADEALAPLSDEEEPHHDDFDFGDEPPPRPRGRADLDDELLDEEEEGAARVPSPDEEIDPELEEEIRKEIEEIAELEREMGLRGTTEARPRRGDRPAAEEGEAEPGRGGRPARGRGLIKPPIQEVFRRGDEVLVQVIKESIGTKGPTLSTYISIPGRYLVLMPGLNRVGVSRKIADEGQRRRLREIMTALNPPKGLGFIVRTAGLDRSKRDLARDLAYLLRLWKVILRRIKKAKGPTPIYQESDMIYADDPRHLQRRDRHDLDRRARGLRAGAGVPPRRHAPVRRPAQAVRRGAGCRSSTSTASRRRSPGKIQPPAGRDARGGLDRHRPDRGPAVAIDVNSSNFRRVENDPERTAYEMNLRAAKEIARQLRLRDLGGVIVNDFIDMRDEKNRRRRRGRRCQATRSSAEPRPGRRSCG